MRLALSPAKDHLLVNLAVLIRELRTRMRGRRAAIIITLYLAMLAIGGALVLEAQRTSMQFSYNPAVAARTGTQVFTVLAILQMALVVFIVPGLTGAAIAGERDRQTLDLLLSTQVSSLGIVLGKLLSSISYVLLLLLTALPIFSLAFLFGGVSPRQVAVVFPIYLGAAMALGSLGVTLSTWLRRGQLATIAAYALTFALILGTLGLSVYIMANVPVYPPPSPPPPYSPSSTVQFAATRGSSWQWAHAPLVFNPFMGLVSVLPGLGVPFSTQGHWGGFAFWQANLVADAVIVLVCTWLSVVGLRPRRRRLRFWRRHRAAASLTEATP
ncbi:MAG: ABC transporter permease subunit [Chloroflexi bacterium]|nr:ABC transporter permease subunit [Chloroflexota bacterium]